jgi:hypothetical protein
MIRIAVLASLISACASAQSEAPKPHDGFSWLTGCWELEDGSIREHWSAPEGEYMFGFAVNYHQGEPVFFEQLRIDPGAIPVLNAYPAGKGPSPFPMTESGEQSVVFANDQHDYPQRITYARQKDSLIATIALSDGGNLKTFDYRACAKD